ncbi:energy transducer TonB [bacterium]|nr:energy transducer TonB [bacterium]
MIRYQTAWQREGFLLTRRFVSYLSHGAKAFRPDINSRKNTELGLIVSLAALLLIFVVSKRIDVEIKQHTVELAPLIIETVEQTRQSVTTAAPSRPTVPIAAETEEISDDITMDIADFDMIYDPPPPPPPPDHNSNEIVFVAFSEPPRPVGGYEALHRNIVYPDMARLAGIEGTVVLNVHILTDGTVDEIRMLQSVSKVLDDAAEAAVRSVKWLPAKQREDPVAVWFAVPIEFKLEKLD